MLLKGETHLLTINYVWTRVASFFKKTERLHQKTLYCFQVWMVHYSPSIDFELKMAKKSDITRIFYEG